MEKAILWSASVLVAGAVAIAFLFTTFQTSAAADKTTNYIDTRLTNIEKKIDDILNELIRTKRIR